MIIKHMGKEYWGYNILINNIIVGNISWSHDRNCWILSMEEFVKSGFEGFDLKQLRLIVLAIPKLNKDYNKGVIE